MSAPQLAEILFVPSAVCAGSPVRKYTGSVMSPPPPAMESTSPPRNVPAHTSAVMPTDSVMPSPSFAEIHA